MHFSSCGGSGQANLRDIAAVAERCLAVLDLADRPAANEYGYCSVPLCVLDAVFSINARYAGVQNTVARYCTYYRLPQWLANEPHPPARERQEPVSSFVEKVRGMGVERFVAEVLDNRQRTSTRSGILKGEAALLFAEALKRGGVEYLQDVPRAAQVGIAESGVLRIRGQSSGITWRYFLMLAGFQDLVKPDRMILGFLQKALGRTVSVAEAQVIIEGACNELQAEHPHLTPRMLDHRIWAHQRVAGP